ncbi:hypothetical protein FDZ74_01370, partial [bacterium]
MAINYTVSSDAIVTVTILQGGTPVKVLTPGELKPAGSHTVYWDGKDAYNVMVGDASYTYQIEAVSPVEPSFIASPYRSAVVVEKEAPRVTDISVIPDPYKIGAGNLTITYTPSESVSLTAKITDSAGNVVRTLLNGVARSAVPGSVTWDGKDSGGQYVAEGVYAAVISAVDNYGKTSGDYVTRFTAGYQPAISNAAISPTLFNPTDPVNNQATISFNTSHDALVTLEILNSSNAPVRTLVNGQRLAAGAQTFKWDGRDDAGTIVGDGTHYYRITAVSPTVNIFTSTIKNSFTVDKGAPAVTELTLNPDPYRLGTTTQLTVMYNLSENATVSVNIYNGTTLVRKLVQNQVQIAGYRTASWDGKDDAGSNVGEGIYTVVIRAVDSYGQYGEAQGKVAAGYLPTISSVTCSPDPFNPPLNGQAAINFTLSNDAKVTVSVLKNNVPVRTVVSGALKTAGAHTVYWDGKDDANQPVSDGPYTYQIEAVSPTVATFFSTYKVNTTVEAGNPALTDLIVSPPVVKKGAGATLMYTLSEPATVTVQIMTYQRQAVRDFPAEVKAGGGYYSLAWDTKDNFGNLVATGDYILKVSAVDKFNKTGSAELAFQAGAVPVITNAAASPGTINAAAGEQTTISFNVSERSYVTISMYDSNNLLWKTLTHYKDVTGSDTAVWDGTGNSGQTAVGLFVYKIDAASVIGNFRAQQVSGSVYVSSVPGTGGGATCTNCHTTYPVPAHPMSNCFGCHGNNEPLKDCAGCHNTAKSHTDAAVLGKFECSYCHTSKYSYKIPIHPADIDAYHATTTNMAECQNCHNPALTTEHLNRTNKVTGVKYDCYTCHGSTVAGVVYAINNKLKNCDACHATTSHQAVHNNTTFTALARDPDMDCALCHNSIISDEHTVRQNVYGVNYTCDTCHAKTAPATVQNAVYNKNKNCEACHINPATNQPTVHTKSGSPLHDSTYMLNPEVNCKQCHANNVKVEHVGRVSTTTNLAINCATCHK